jgi:AraC-like DNA-binding protein
MKLTFAQPDPRLANHVSVYYHLRVDYPLIEDFERADVGYLRLMFSGRGHYNYRGGHSDPDCAAMLLGPATEIASYSVAGPLDSFGCVLLPQFWGGIAKAGADEYANRARDAAALFGPDIEALCAAMTSAPDVDAMGRLMDGFLVPRIKPLPKDQLRVIAKIGEWISAFPIPAPEALYAACDQSDRTVMRIANRYFGAPPSLLARKFRALRTASRLIGTRGPVPDALVSEYSDRAHMTREIKHFTGMTPRNLQIASNPIMQVTLHPDNFRMDAPWT